MRLVKSKKFIFHIYIDILFSYILINDVYTHGTPTKGGGFEPRTSKVSAPLTNGRNLINISDLVNIIIFGFWTESRTDLTKCLRKVGTK